jgi:uncharacterized membrane protein HdeD (DUF308 family)
MTMYQLKRTLNNMLWGTLTVIGIILLVVLGIMFFTAIMSVITFFLAIGFAYWLLGGKFTIMKNDKPIGYVRWFEFVEKDQGQ